MDFNDFLLKASLDPAQVLILRHTPREPQLRRRFEWIATERPDLFVTYQEIQFPRAEAAMSKAKWVASFIGRPEKQAIFVGVYQNGSPTKISKKQFWSNPLNQELRDAFGMEGWNDEETRDHVLRFDLKEMKAFQEWRGRLVVDWPGSELAWYRWADKNKMALRCIHEQCELSQHRPPWNEILLTWSELQVLPRSWKDTISQWRGVYLIYDQSDGSMYIGSAYGRENIYQRWAEYAKSGHGGNKHLKNRSPENFVFSILQLVPIDVEPREVIQLEVSWMNRLHSIYPDGLNDRKQATSVQTSSRSAASP